MRPLRVVLALVGAILMTACGALRGGEAGNDDTETAGISQEKGATILMGAALKDGPGTVLAAMTGKVPNMRVRKVDDQCPTISLRNHVSFVGIVNPHVYVDGTRSNDTCILEALRTSDVDRVEVYPLGFTTRPGYGTHGQGLILVFMRSG